MTAHRYAQIDLATGMVVAVSELSGEVDAPHMIPLAEGQVVPIPGRWTGTAFEAALPPDQPSDWYIDVGPFFDRFGAQKIPILASADPVVQAVVKDCQVRKYLDLQGRAADIGAALELLVSKGFAIDKTAILTTRPTDEERHKG